MQLAVIDTFMNIREDQVNIKFMAETWPYYKPSWTLLIFSGAFIWS